MKHGGLHRRRRMFCPSASATLWVQPIRLTGLVRHLDAEASDWRNVIEDHRYNLFSEWQLGQVMHDLTAYARFGIDISAEAEDTSSTAEARISDRLGQAEAFLEAVDLDAWLGSDRDHDFETVVAMARCRYALDHGEPVRPEDLARLGGVSDSRMRGLARPKPDAALPLNADRKVPAQAATDWLKSQSEFRTSIWKEMRPAPRDPCFDPDHAMPDPVFIPEASDGSRFTPDLETSSGFRIGRKGHELDVEDYDAALEKLAHMDRPSWRRPSPKSGRASIVTAATWVRVSRESLGLAK